MPLEGWFDVCRAAAEDVRGALRSLQGRAQREPVVGLGLGGDETTAVDEAAERVVVERLRVTGEPFVLVSEELGEEVVNGGDGAFLDGVRLGGERPKNEIEILAFEATTTAYVAERAGAVAPLAYRLRIFGSLALSLCHLAAGRVDAVCSLKPARAVDIAAAQLLVHEDGLAVELFESTEPFEHAPLDLGARSRVVAAGTSELCTQLASALAELPAQ